MARPGGFEPSTNALEGRCSIQLSYGRKAGAGDGNRTHVVGLEGRNSTIELHPRVLIKNTILYGVCQRFFYLFNYIAILFLLPERLSDFNQ